MKIVMLGSPGAGKGTQAKMLAERYGIPHISTGDIFRSNIKEGTALGKKAKEYMDSGTLVPDELTVDLVLDRLCAPDCADGYILDGFPRTLFQAQKLTEALEAKGTAIDKAVDVEVGDDDIVVRMGGRRTCPKCGASYHLVNIPPKKEGICDKCGEALTSRKDDEPETVRRRLAVYHEQTQPLIEYYEKKGIVLKVDGTKTAKEVLDSIMLGLGA